MLKINISEECLFGNYQIFECISYTDTIVVHEQDLSERVVLKRTIKVNVIDAVNGT